jgi:hypothetical protein
MAAALRRFREGSVAGCRSGFDAARCESSPVCVKRLGFGRVGTPKLASKQVNANGGFGCSPDDSSLEMTLGDDRPGQDRQDIQSVKSLKGNTPVTYLKNHSATSTTRHPGQGDPGPQGDQRELRAPAA